MRARLARQAILVVAVDESPTTRFWSVARFGGPSPGSIEQQEFEYTRHGTVNLLFFLVVHSGRMEVADRGQEGRRNTTSRESGRFAAGIGT